MRLNESQIFQISHTMSKPYTEPPRFFTAFIDGNDEKHSVAKVHGSGVGNSMPPPLSIYEEEKMEDDEEEDDDSSRSRNWCYTLFDMTKYPDFGKKVKYHVFQIEVCPTTGRNHFQGYVQLFHPKSLGGMKKNIHATAHWKQRYKDSSHEQARAYCMKSETRHPGHPDQVGPFEMGTPTNDQGKRSDLDDVAAAVKEGKTDEEIAAHSPTWIIKYSKGINNLRNAIQRHREGESPEVTIIYGPSGSGKTHFVYARHGWDHVYSVTSQDGKWWDGYNQQEAVLFDEAEFNMNNYKMLKQICDKYPYQVEVKGSFKKFKSPYIYFVNSIEKKAKAFLHGDLYRRVNQIIRFKADQSYEIEPKDLQRLPVPGDVGFPDIENMYGAK